MMHQRLRATTPAKRFARSAAQVVAKECGVGSKSSKRTLLSVARSKLPGMTRVDAHLLPGWARPRPVEVFDLHWLALRRYQDTEGWESEAAAGIASSVTWTWGYGTGPATGRPEQPVTHRVATAEWWAAMAVADRGGTSERQRRGVCWELGVPYWAPDYDGMSLEEGYAIYQTLSWLLGTLDGWQRGRQPPLSIPARTADGSVPPDDQRSRDLVALIEDTQRRAAASSRRTGH